MRQASLVEGSDRPGKCTHAQEFQRRQVAHRIRNRAAELVSAKGSEA